MAIQGSPGGSRVKRILLCMVLPLIAHGLGLLQLSNVLDEDVLSTIRVATLDPGLTQSKKWSEDAASENIIRMTELGSEVTNDHPTLVVLPETTVPGVPGYDPATDAFLNVFPGMVNAVTVVGAVELEVSASGEDQYFNSALLLNREGQVVDRYRKTHLVPFGEYIPLIDQIPLMKYVMPVGFFSCVPGHGVRVFHDPGAEGLAPLICFEDTIPELSRDAVNKGASCLIFITNDAWYPGTSASLQHLSHCMFRCVETGRWGIRSGNMGATGFVSPQGRLDILDEAGATIGYRVRDVPLISRNGVGLSSGHSAATTAYVRYGDICWAWPCVLVSCVSCIFMVADRKMRAS